MAGFAFNRLAAVVCLQPGLQGRHLLGSRWAIGYDLGALGACARRQHGPLKLGPDSSFRDLDLDRAAGQQRRMLGHVGAENQLDATGNAAHSSRALLVVELADAVLERYRIERPEEEGDAVVQMIDALQEDDGVSAFLMAVVLAGLDFNSSHACPPRAQLDHGRPPPGFGRSRSDQSGCSIRSASIAVDGPAFRNQPAIPSCKPHCLSRPMQAVFQLRL